MLQSREKQETSAKVAALGIWNARCKEEQIVSQITVKVQSLFWILGSHGWVGDVAIKNDGVVVNAPFLTVEQYIALLVLMKTLVTLLMKTTSIICYGAFIVYYSAFRRLHDDIQTHNAFWCTVSTVIKHNEL